ncbi:hypothetical protein RJJ65_25635 [Rhizobium hidalgonense]|uniref:Uncharacterized protein n=1 Tax=Rhizobium hidalgonense TaxID=1538159 RepID=A0A2A6K7V7_9HYPH|nr:hypothetical protein [Rhizobium hidalgonense]MDR9775982.1 hypothetical protein [Rhizobium hidalgonense]MDR9814127.1 hypothetical protein [Rhizobium hidalgonense]MDR9820789.1 hypothetical protein [Rhizobium hidalgonense]PDT20986.1 hypothetical protein CO674_25190 [Rhizobium hidalgonense]PON07218.1 hypothetical protein ATY29_12865 [Rhizobium hidalgonense]
MDTATRWALFLGALALVSWMAGGLAAVLANMQFSQHRQRAAEYLTLGLSAAGFISVAAMAVILVAQ